MRTGYKSLWCFLEVILLSYCKYFPTLVKIFFCIIFSASNNGNIAFPMQWGAARVIEVWRWNSDKEYPFMHVSDYLYLRLPVSQLESGKETVALLTWLLMTTMHSILQCKYLAWNKLHLELVCQILSCSLANWGFYTLSKIGCLCGCAIPMIKWNLTFSYLKCF